MRLLTKRFKHVDFIENEYEVRLKKSNPFIDWFVPTEYTTGFANYKSMNTAKVTKAIKEEYLMKVAKIELYTHGKNTYRKSPIMCFLHLEFKTKII